MSSLSQRLSDIDSAREAAEKPAVRHALSTSALERHQKFLLADSYAFTWIICNHHDLMPEIHMPLSYAACGLADKLRWCLYESGMDSYIIRQFRDAFRVRQIDPYKADGFARFRDQLDYLNFRVSRGTFKSSVITHGGATFVATSDPNTTARITHAIDDKAWEFCDQIADTIRSDRYRDHFPDRIPDGNMNELVSMKRITLGGRTISHPQSTIQASGYQTKDISAHYDTFWTDDLVVEGNATPALLPGVHTWLRNMPGLFMKTRRVRTIFVGTRWEDNDDHYFLTSKDRALDCLTIFVPIEVYESGDPDNIMERGVPTMPTFYDRESIGKLQRRVLSDPTEKDGVRSWRCNYLLSPPSEATRLFPLRITEDPDRAWLGPYPHPLAKKDPSKYGNGERFLVARYARNEERAPIHRKTGKPLDMRAYTERGEDWHADARLLLFDPWKSLSYKRMNDEKDRSLPMDRVLTLDPSWTVGGDNWAITAAAIDYEFVQFQLETMSGVTGLEGWIEALAELDEIYEPRIIGMDRSGMQDPMIQNLLKTDKRLRRLRSRCIGIPHNRRSKKARIRAGVAEPLKSYNLLLAPNPQREGPDGGARATRDEMDKYRGDVNAVDGILDSLSMVPAVALRLRDPKEEKEEKEQERERSRTARRLVDPALGVTLAA